jgi:glycosyltransferase involved in cell wall biosynthesis
MGGGGEKWVMNVRKLLEKRGHDLRYFTNEYDPNLAIFKEFNQKKIIIVKESRGFRGKFRSFRELKLMMNVAKRIAKFNPETILLSTDQHLARIIKKYCKKTIISYFHTMSPKTNENFLTRFYLAIPRFLGYQDYISSDRLIANSLYTANLVRTFYPNISIKIIYPSVNSKEITPNFSYNYNLLCVGRIAPFKNQIFLLKVLPYLLEKHPNVRLIIAGYFDPQYKNYLKEMNKIIKNLQLEDHVETRLNCPQSEINILIKDCSIFLFPSINEFFGMAVLEAMAYGKCVIAHNSGGVREIITNESGFLLGENPKDWALRINMLLEDKNHLLEMGHNARKRAERFTWEKAVNDLEKTIKSL